MCRSLSFHRPTETNISCVAPLICEGRTTLDAAFGTFQFAIGICFIFFVGVLMLYSVISLPLEKKTCNDLVDWLTDFVTAERFPIFDLGFRDCDCAILHYRPYFSATVSSSAQATSALVGLSSTFFLLYFPHVANYRFTRRMVLLSNSTLVIYRQISKI